MPSKSSIPQKIEKNPRLRSKVLQFATGSAGIGRDGLSSFRLEPGDGGDGASETAWRAPTNDGPWENVGLHLWRWPFFGIYPRCSMYGIFTYIYPQNYPNVGK